MGRIMIVDDDNYIRELVSTLLNCGDTLQKEDLSQLFDRFFRVEKSRASNREYTRAAITAGTIMSVFVPLITMLISLSTLLIVWFGGTSVAAGTMKIGSIMRY